MANAPESGHTPEPEEGGPVKSFLEHLEDLRWALVKCASAIGIAVLICLLAGNRVVAILLRPLQQAAVRYHGTNMVATVYFGTNRLGTWALDSSQEGAFKEMFRPGDGRFIALDLVPIGTNQPPAWGFQLDTNVDAAAEAQRMHTSVNAFGPAKAFLVGFHVAVYAGIALASPFVLFFTGQFVLPALRIKERKYLYRGLAFAVPLFLCGVVFCYFILLPAALAASQFYSDLLGFSSSYWDAGDYISFVCKFMLGMGLGFELPVVVLVLVKIGLLSYSTLSKARPYMIVINLILGAVLTTPEVFTQILMAVPLQLLFEISVWIAWYWERQERKRVAAEEAGTGA
jgi:sec-independent protein translocase protein TatC